MRQVVLDSETTGLNVSAGHRVIEIGCVEILDRQVTENQYRVFLNPDRLIEVEAMEVHGITDEFLVDKPRFGEVVDEFLEFVNGAELVIHNAPFDVGFLNAELERLSSRYRPLTYYCSVLDSLVLAREMHPGMKNNLDAICKRYGVNNSQRELHGALLDAQILAEAYLAMTGGQVALALATASVSGNDEGDEIAANRPPALVRQASDSEQRAHQQRLLTINDRSADGCLWEQ